MLSTLMSMVDMIMRLTFLLITLEMIQLHSNTKFKLIFIVQEAVNGPLPLLAEEIQDVFRSGEEEDLLLEQTGNAWILLTG